MRGFICCDTPPLGLGFLFKSKRESKIKQGSGNCNGNPVGSVAKINTKEVAERHNSSFMQLTIKDLLYY